MRLVYSHCLISWLTLCHFVSSQMETWTFCCYNSELIGPSMIVNQTQTMILPPSCFTDEMRYSCFNPVFAHHRTKCFSFKQRSRFLVSLSKEHFSSSLLDSPHGLEQTVDSCNVLFEEKSFFPLNSAMYTVVLLMVDSGLIVDIAIKAFSLVPCGLPDYYTPALGVIFVVQPLLEGNSGVECLPSAYQSTGRF